MSDVVIGAKLTADASGYVKSIGEIRKEIKLAEKDVIAMSEKFGVTSKEAAAAAKRAAELKDTIGDAKQLIDAFNPDTKFRAFGASIQTVIGGFTALTGVMGLLGVESDEVQKTLLKVQSALALSQGIAQLQEGMQAFKNLGSVIQQTLGKSGIWGVALAGVALGVAALMGAFDSWSVKAKELVASLKELAKGQAEATKEVNLTRNAFEQARLGIISKKEALDKYNTGIGKTIGAAKDLNEAEKLTAENADAYIKVQGLKAQANYILAKSSQLAAEAAIKEAELVKSGMDNTFGQKGLFQQQIEQQKQDAADLMLLIEGINKQIVSTSAKFKTIVEPTAAVKGQDKDVTDYREKKRALQQIDQEFTDLETSQAQLKILQEQSTTTAIGASMLQRISDHASGVKQITATEEQQTIARMQLADAEHEHRIQIASASAQLLDNISELVGKQTLAGKILGIASATINTYVGVTKALASFSPPVNFIMAAASLAAGLITIRKIVAVQIPGKSGGGSAPAVAAPLVPRLPEATRLDQTQLNTIGNAANRSFVLEHDVSTNVERVRRVNRAARIG